MGGSGRMTPANFFSAEHARVRGEMARPPTYAEALARPVFSVEDVPQYLPRLDATFEALDAVVDARRANTSTTFRLGSIAAHRSQVDFYWRIAASPTIRTVCEVGFNAGHSTAVWLSANPTAIVHSFDLFHMFGLGCVAELHRRFGAHRLVIHRGDSVKTVPATPLPPCDLVHVDGRHSYGNTLRDFLNLLPKSSPHAAFLFDDQCDAAYCSVPSLVPGEPTLATCDLVVSGVLTPIVTFLNGTRQFALYRRNATTVMPSGSDLPCSPLCKIRWADEQLQRKWDRSAPRARYGWQRQLRPKDCGLADHAVSIAITPPSSTPRHAHGGGQHRKQVGLSCRSTATTTSAARRKDNR